MKRRTSDALVELRTVASRAETAMERIRNLPVNRASTRATGKELEAKWGKPYPDHENLTGFHARTAEDPEEPEMIEALRQVVALLERWR